MFTARPQAINIMGSKNSLGDLTMVNKLTATILLIAITVVLASVLMSASNDSAGKLMGATNEKIKVGYVVNANRLTIVDITGNNSINVPPGMMTIYSADKASPIGANILWRGNSNNLIHAGSAITNNIDEKIDLKMFYNDYPIIDAEVGAGPYTMESQNYNSFGNGTCQDCNASSTITFS